MSIGRVKILFPLEKDSDGYPPVEYESVWGARIRGMIYKIDSIPFFTYEVSLGDEIAVLYGDSEYRYLESVRISSNSLVRVLCFKETNQAEIRASLSSIGCDTEWLGQFRIISVNIPEAVKIDVVRETLDRFEEQGLLEYEEAIVRD